MFLTGDPLLIVTRASRAMSTCVNTGSSAKWVDERAARGTFAATSGHVAVLIATVSSDIEDWTMR